VVLFLERGMKVVMRLDLLLVVERNGVPVRRRRTRNLKAVKEQVLTVAKKLEAMKHFRENPDMKYILT
jgi:hypothetical protein